MAGERGAPSSPGAYPAPGLDCSHAVTRSVALLVVRRDPDTGPLLLLGYWGGRFWARKDAGSWSIPNGEDAEDEPAEAAARRELAEQTGYAYPPDVELGDLGEFTQSRKTVRVFLGVEEPDLPTTWGFADFRSNTFEVE
ncbi:NUDIX domain-containing protein [Serinibacter arcticus]|uniref:MutT-like protein n=1 Tax=Serinibacter arcticus TaxID=1655435 RepID=A0A4Z1E0G3_9MICO|nr:NUDIX domain-containing protein [Serinibacter arcticus]TGO05364.1 MutT-like protein [Serinibacter arcticus]